MLKARFDRAAVSLRAVVAWILLGDFSGAMQVDPTSPGIPQLTEVTSPDARHLREQIVVMLRDGDLPATGRYSDTPTPPWECERRRWMMHSGRHSDIPAEHWRSGKYSWDQDTLDLLEGQYIEIRVPRFMVVAIWPPCAEGAASHAAGAYTTPYLHLMQRAIVELGISASSQPKKETVEAWFQQQTIDQRPVSDNFARHLATFVRLPDAQRGGNRKWRMAG